jgi:hypothetical protein
MYPKTDNVSRLNAAANNHGLTRLAAGLTHLPTGLRVRTHIWAGTGICSSVCDGPKMGPHP